MDVSTLFNVKDKVVLVTGGSRGIGLMIAQGFVANGARVYISSRKAAVCDGVAAELNKQGPGRCFSIPADLQKLDDVKHLVAELSKREKELHVLVNNAGANWAAPIGQYPDEAFQALMSLNVNRVFTLTQGLLPLLEAAASDASPASVINIGSIDGLRTPPHETYAYAASKAALHQLTRVMAGQFGHKRITVNAVAPGPFASKMMEETLKNSMDVILATCPLERIGQPTDMAGVCLFLASKAGSFVNGAILPVDGGIIVKARI
ncbi:short-chain dehydrogenase/reductase-like protein sdr [Thamnocephalis sphaerospora]|uniref:Short-chain dehydrogenase/reductase-like protein sdr n=1 Tax=Thamnocephalis sphaerospora TaxID=78915 RepID=A0A4P9XI03_9FUNG|nr:short-chain dehydrogenase/reductase-like protein sdr [Thamnocephalis sphaerospora]|eukprot:RKP05345.1 short-chain dehydrogenase/reductase-like protein sdr [Thamnocephalis sphaerospora]